MSAAFLYTTFDDDAGDMASVDALFAGGKQTITLEELRVLAASRIDQACVRLRDDWAAVAVEEFWEALEWLRWRESSSSG